MKTADMLKIVRVLIAAKRKAVKGGCDRRLIRALDIATYEAGIELGQSLKD